MACGLIGAKPLPDAIRACRKFDPQVQTSVKFEFKYKIFIQKFTFENVVRKMPIVLQWRHNERDGVSNHQPRDCLLNCLFKAQIKENIKASRHWALWGEFTGDRWIPHTKGSDVENISSPWRHHMSQCS